MRGCLLIGENETLLIGRYTILRSANRESVLVAQTWDFFRLLKFAIIKLYFPERINLAHNLSPILFISFFHRSLCKMIFRILISVKARLFHLFLPHPFFRAIFISNE